jgi:hypothetical protein
MAANALPEFLRPSSFDVYLFANILCVLPEWESGDNSQHEQLLDFLVQQFFDAESAKLRDAR